MQLNNTPQAREENESFFLSGVLQIKCDNKYMGETTNTNYRFAIVYEYTTHEGGVLLQLGGDGHLLKVLCLVLAVTNVFKRRAKPCSMASGNCSSGWNKLSVFLNTIRIAFRIRSPRGNRNGKRKQTTSRTAVVPLYQRRTPPYNKHPKVLSLPTHA